MIVSKEGLQAAIDILKQESFLGFDTETFGLGWKDKPFALAFFGRCGGFYFNFYNGSDIPQANVLDKREVYKALDEVFHDLSKKIFIHNAKFDCLMLHKEGVEIKSQVHCTMTAERLIKNDAFKYSLDVLAQKRGFAKDKTVEEYIKKHKLYRAIRDEETGKVRLDMFYHLVPFDMITKYALTDAKLHYLIGMDQVGVINETSL